MSVEYNLTVHQLDVRTAYLNADIDSFSSCSAEMPPVLPKGVSARYINIFLVTLGVGFETNFVVICLTKTLLFIIIASAQW